MNMLTPLVNNVAAGLGASSDLYKYLKLSYNDEDISQFFKGFYQFFYDNGYNFDISGFTLIFFYPPHLSGSVENARNDLQIIKNGDTSTPIRVTPPIMLQRNFKDFVTFALELIPPDVTVEKTSIGLIGNEVFEYATHVHAAGDFSLTYIDSENIFLYTYHSIWVKYIHGVLLGHIVPIEEYITENNIDYMGSLYFVKFDADMKHPRMIGKALGIYPNAVPFKESIGNRSQNQVSIMNVSYNCAYFYEEPFSINGETNALWDEFMKNFGTLFTNN